MSSSLKNSPSNGSDKNFASEECQAKVNEVRKLIGSLPEKLSIYCSDATICRYLTARNWHVKKATKMLKDSLKWRAEYKPEEIRWEDVAHEAETGKVYRSNYADKNGRTVLVMRPSYENSKSTKGQIKHLVYCMENAVLNLPPNQQQMVWLIDFQGFSLSNLSVKVTRETAHVLQEHYPERLGVAILYNPPKFFEPFWTIVKPFLEPKTRNKVKFVYSDDPNTKKIMEDLFDMDQLDSGFGGNSNAGFDIAKYAERMKEDDKRMPAFWSRENLPSEAAQPVVNGALPSLDADSDAANDGKPDAPTIQEIKSEAGSTDNGMLAASGSSNPVEEVH